MISPTTERPMNKNILNALSARIMQDQVPFASIGAPGFPSLREVAEAVERGDKAVYVPILDKEIETHEVCGNYLKAKVIDLLRGQALKACGGAR